MSLSLSVSTPLSRPIGLIRGKSVVRRRKCERCGSYMDVTATYPNHVNLYCSKCGYRDTYPKLDKLKKKRKTVKRGD